MSLDYMTMKQKREFVKICQDRMPLFYIMHKARRELRVINHILFNKIELIVNYLGLKLRG